MSLAYDTRTRQISANSPPFCVLLRRTIDSQYSFLDWVNYIDVKIVRNRYRFGYV